jgi:hypothetical protein
MAPGQDRTRRPLVRLWGPERGTGHGPEAMTHDHLKDDDLVRLEEVCPDIRFLTRERSFDARAYPCRRSSARTRQHTCAMVLNYVDVWRARYGLREARRFWAKATARLWPRARNKPI